MRGYSSQQELFYSPLWPHTACYYPSWHEKEGGAKVDAAWCDSCFPGATDTWSKWIESVCTGRLGDMTWTWSHKYGEQRKVCVEPRCLMKSVSTNLKFASIFVWYCGFQKPFCSKTHTHTTVGAKLMMCNCVYCPPNLFFYLNIILDHKEQLFTVSTPTTLVAIFKAQWGIILGGLGFSYHQYVRSFSFSANTPSSIAAIKSSFLCRGLKGLAFKLQLTNSWSLTAKLRKICNREKSQRVGGFGKR